MLRLRTIRQCVNEILKHDPASAITEHSLRRLVRNGTIPVFRIGNRQIVDFQTVIDFFNEESLRRSDPQGNSLFE